MFCSVSAKRGMHEFAYFSIGGLPTKSGSTASAASQYSFTNATVYPDLAPPDAPFCTGAMFSASGLTLLAPLEDSIDFFSTQTATLQGRLLMPELSPVGDRTSGAIALDPNQQTIYAISASGLTVATLPSTVEQLRPFPSPYVPESSHPVPPAAAPRLRAPNRARR